jgi:hypothetical protein
MIGPAALCSGQHFSGRRVVILAGAFFPGVAMIVSSAELAAMIREIEVEDPIDYADLPYDEDALRLLVCSQVHEIVEQAADMDEDNRQMLLMAVAAKLVLENLVLNVRLLQMQGRSIDDSSAALFRRLRGRSS